MEAFRQMDSDSDEIDYTALMNAVSKIFEEE